MRTKTLFARKKMPHPSLDGVNELHVCDRRSRNTNRQGVQEHPYSARVSPQARNAAGALDPLRDDGDVFASRLAANSNIQRERRANHSRRGTSILWPLVIERGQQIRQTAVASLDGMRLAREREKALERLSCLGRGHEYGFRRHLRVHLDRRAF